MDKKGKLELCMDRIRSFGNAKYSVFQNKNKNKKTRKARIT